MPDSTDYTDETKIGEYLNAEIPLDLFLMRVSRLTEALFAQLDGAMPATWFLLLKNGAVERFFDLGSEMAQQFFKADAVIRYALLHPTRNMVVGDEVLAIFGQDQGDGASYLCAARRIVRPQDGEPYLGELGNFGRCSAIDLRPERKLH